MGSAFIIDDFQPLVRNTLRGFARVRVPSGMIFHDVAIHQKDRATWASPSSKPMVRRDGSVIKGADGRISYSPVVGFADKELRDRWSAAVIDALQARYPDALS